MPESSQKSNQRSSLLKYASRILSYRPYFRFKLREKLFLQAQKLNFENPEAIIDSLLDDLKKSGYLNDQYLAQAYVRRQLSKGYGPKIIAFKLKFLGLDRETISRCLESEVTEESEISSIKKYCQKYPHLDQRKLISKLYFRGYLGTIIKKAFDGDW